MIDALNAGSVRSVILIVLASFLLATPIVREADAESCGFAVLRKRACAVSHPLLRLVIFALGGVRTIVRTWALGPAVLAATATLLLTSPLTASTVLISFLSVAFIAEIDSMLGTLLVPAFVIKLIEDEITKLADEPTIVRLFSWLEHRIIIIVDALLIVVCTVYADSFIPTFTSASWYFDSTTSGFLCNEVSSAFFHLAILLTCFGGLTGTVLEYVAAHHRVEDATGLQGLPVFSCDDCTQERAPRHTAMLALFVILALAIGFGAVAGVYCLAYHDPAVMSHMPLAAAFARETTKGLPAAEIEPPV